MAVDVVALRNRILVREAVKDCKSCALWKGCNGPVPFSGPSPSRIAIVGEAPGGVEDKERTPFVGPSGQLARRWLLDGGILPETVAFTNTVSCYPKRTPTEDEVRACRKNLHDQLEIIQPAAILILGGVAVASWWSQVHPNPRMGEMRGRFWKVVEGPGWQEGRDTWAMGTWHPSAVLRNSELAKEAAADVRRFRLLVTLLGDGEGGLTPTTAGFSKLVDNDYCIKGCGEWSDRFLTHDNTDVTDRKGITGGIGWCQKHWDQRIGKTGLGRKTTPGRRKKKENGQGTLI